MARLALVAELIPPRSRVVDVGADHGRLAHRLLATGRARHCIATEKTPARLARVGRFPPGHRLAARLELRAGDGLSCLRRADHLDVAVLAGMGARTMVRILAAPHRARLGLASVVVQPQTEPARLRRWLAGNGFRIVAERIAVDRDALYPILRAELGREELSPRSGLSADDVLVAGPRLLDAADPVVERYWSEELERLATVALRLGDRAPHVLRADLARARRILDAVRRLL